MRDLDIYGHINEFNQLLNAYKKKFPHSWIFFGPKGSGKYKILLEFIKNIYKNNKSYLQNIFEINGNDDCALIDDVRRIISQTSLTNSSDSDLKSFFIINNAEFLNFNSLNALLKTIEEPPKNTIIIIITNNLKKIPKTITSRCMHLYFNPMNSKEFNLMKKTNDLSKNKNFRISNFNPSIYKRIITPNGKKIEEMTLDIISKKELDFDELDNLFKNISKDFDNNFELIISIFFDYVKNIFLNNFNEIKQMKVILIYLNTINKTLGKILNIEKKKVLYFVFTEFFNLNIKK